MHRYSSFTIYDASAGAGKTYTLVKEYLKILLASEKKDRFKHILAITFTNKAVGEMKDRILTRLIQFSKESILNANDGMFQEIAVALKIDEQTLHERASITLNSLIHNYAAFEVVTIDKFTHKIIRTFAKDLKLSLNFDVEMDADFVLQQAVDQLISKIGYDDKITHTLIDYALEKITDDKTWDIAFDLNKIAKLLLNENHLKYINTIKQKSFEDFEALKNVIKLQIKNKETHLQKLAKSILEKIKAHDLVYEDFTRKSLPLFFEKISYLDLTVNLETKWLQEIETTKLHTAKTNPNAIDAIEALRPDFIESINDIKKNIVTLKFLQEFYKNITPLSVINSIYKSLETLKEEQNILLISDFNNIIAKNIANQPAPFIYERLGEKFNHHFIDEFQDTSSLQWQNIIPLVENAVSQEFQNEEKGSLTIVGDAKQSIYRWRGGDVNQFIKLYNKELPFYVNEEDVAVINLPTNYRSFSNIVQFNNTFFSHCANYLEDKNYADIYLEGNQQQYNDKTGGYVEISFVESSNKTEDFEEYPNRVLEIIQSLTDFDYSEICVITRKKEQGIAISKLLTDNNIPIISSETLLLNNAESIRYIIDLLNFIVTPLNEELKANVLFFWSKHLPHNYDTQDFLSVNLKCNLETLLETHLHISLADLSKYSLYEKVEVLLKHSNLMEATDACVIFFLDFIFQFCQKNQGDIITFLTYWEQKKDTISISSPEHQNAVNIMTIHKSKGLEFPVVIFPFADLPLYNEKESNYWLSINPDNFNGFETAYINFSSYLSNLSPETAAVYEQYKNNLALDHFNLLYVTLTRAVEQLYIVSKKDAKKNTYSELFHSYLERSTLFQHQDNYSFGKKSRLSEKTLITNETVSIDQLISNNKKELNLDVVTTKGLLWDSFQEKAIKRGNSVHHIMQHIVNEHDVDTAFEDFKNSNLALAHNEEELKEIYSFLFKIVAHPELNTFFSGDDTVLNEHEIISDYGKIMIPDRLNIKNGWVSIIDYKTGEYHTKHLEQITDYGDVLSSMGYQIKKKLLVYIDQEIIIKSVD